MVAIESACLLVVVAYLVSALRRAPDAPVYLQRYGLLALASWVAEDSCIRLYGFYSYSPEWFPQLDRTPLMIALIWPVVILSAGELAGHLLREGRQEGERGGVLLPLGGGLLVLCDAAFIEPVAVRAGLWTWTEPGLFGVPPIGLFGWAFFAAACLATLERAGAAPANPRRRRGRELLVVLVGPLATHLGLLVSWWGAARWVSRELAGWPGAAVAWGAGLLLAALALRSGGRRKVPLGAIVTRIPAALFFFILLALHGRSQAALVVYALAFAPPYLALVDWGRLASTDRRRLHRPGPGR